MRALGLRSWLALSHLVVIALPVLALVVFGILARELEMEARGQLVHQGHAIAALGAARMARADPGDLAILEGELAQIARETRTGVRLLRPDGTVLLAPELSASSWPEERPGPDVTTVTLVHHGEELVGAVELRMAARPPWLIASASRWRLLGATVGVLVVTLLLSVALAHRISGPLRGLSATARAVGAGSLDGLELLAARRGSRVREVGELAGELGAMAGRLRSRLAYIGEFASHVAHELKTPTTTLRSTLELMRDDDGLPAEAQARFVANGLDELERVDRTVTGLLSLARAEEGGAREPVSLDRLVVACAERHPRLEARAEPAVILADPALVALALDNLVANAQHHGGQQVQVRSWRRGELAGIDVVDDGPGISADNLPRVFDRFFTTAGERGRTGLGLSLVRAVCRARGGEVELESRPGRTRFRMRWPVAPDDATRGFVQGRRRGGDSA